MVHWSNAGVAGTSRVSELSLNAPVVQLLIDGNTGAADRR